MKLKIPSFRDAHVLVIGDVMLDRYWYGTSARVSQEAPVPIVDIESDEDRPGGAANVALNLAALGLDVTLIGVVGDDDAARILRQKLAAANVRSELVVVADWPTIVKVRVVSRRQQMLRMDFEKPITADVQAALTRAFRAHVADADVVVLEDYDKGTLAQPGQLHRHRPRARQTRRRRSQIQTVRRLSRRRRDQTEQRRVRTRERRRDRVGLSRARRGRRGTREIVSTSARSS